MVLGDSSNESESAAARLRGRRAGAVLRTIETTVERHDGLAVLVKASSDPAGRATLAHEARMLGLARHPGVAELRELTEDGERSRLVQTFVSSHPLSATACHSPAHAAGVVAAIAETVADLHHLGVVHGRITAEHVVLDPHGHPILVGFRLAQAARPGVGSSDRADPPVDDAEGPVARHRHDDVAALGRLLRDLVLVHPDTSTVIPERRWRRSRSDAQDRRALLTLADHATADTPSARPGARRFAAAILTAVPTATLVRPGAGDLSRPPRASSHAAGASGADGAVGVTNAEPGSSEACEGAVPPEAGDTSVGPAPQAPATAPPAARLSPGRAVPPRPSRRGRREPGGVAARDRAGGSARTRRGLPWAAGLVGVTLLAFGTASLQNGERPSFRSTAASDASPAERTTTEPPTTGTTATEPAPTATSTAVASGPPAADRSGGPGTTPTPAPAPPPPPLSEPQEQTATPTSAVGEADGPPLRFQPAGIVDHDGRRFTIGAPGDELAIGPLRCAPGEHPRVAVLRAATGELFVFDGWAAPDAPRHAPVVSHVPPGSQWAVRTDRCAPLEVVEPSGRSVAVAVPPEAPS